LLKKIVMCQAKQTKDLVNLWGSFKYSGSRTFKVLSPFDLFKYAPMSMRNCGLIFEARTQKKSKSIDSIVKK